MRLQNRPELLLNSKICFSFKCLINPRLDLIYSYLISWMYKYLICVCFISLGKERETFVYRSFPLPHSHIVKMTEMKAKKWAILDERRKQRRVRTVVFIDRCRLHDVTLLLLHAVFLLPMKLSSYVFRWTDSSTMTWGCSNAWQLFSWFWAW